MKLSIIAFILLFITLTLNAQEWQTDLAQSKAIAKEKNQPIVLVFSGSDWCAPCMKLDQDIFSSEEFKTYAKDNYVMLKADFPRKKKNKLSKEQKKKNNQIAEAYNKKGFFPLVVVLNAQGKVLKKTSYKKTTPKEFIQILNDY